MQYTGFKDKNKVDIYDGDIVRYGFNWIGKISWDKERGYWDLDGRKILGEYIKQQTDRKIKPRVEIIGNVCETPELMEGETK